MAVGARGPGQRADPDGDRSAVTFCDGLFVPTTVILLSAPNQPDYDEQLALTLIYTGPPTTSVEIPAAPVPPPLPAPPTLAVHVLGCTTCHPCNTLGFEVHITNPGEPRLVELKAGARLPDGSAVTILGRHVEETIGSARLEPELGVTSSRHPVTLTLGP